MLALIRLLVGLGPDVISELASLVTAVRTTPIDRRVKELQRATRQLEISEKLHRFDQELSKRKPLSK